MKKKLVYIVTHPISANFLLRGQLRYMKECGFQVTVITAPGRELEQVRQREQVAVVPITFHRSIKPFHDCVALLRLIWTLYLLKPHIVNASTPKAGLLGMIASWITRVPVRIYLLRGIPLETAQGIQRYILWLTELIASACAHRVICISNSLRRVYIKRGLVASEKTDVLCGGSSNGIDVEHFAPTPDKLKHVETLRWQIGLRSQAPTIGFVGRLTKDKGIEDLINIFITIREKYPAAQLLIVGEFEQGNPIEERYQELIKNHAGIKWVGFVEDPAPYYLLMDIFAFPSKREGFGNVLIEASCSRVPVVAYRITGVVNAISHGISGTLVEFGDTEAFADSICRYIEDQSIFQAHREKGFQWARDNFQREHIWRAWNREYLWQLTSKKVLPT